jgi:hypothetical protein
MNPTPKEQHEATFEGYEPSPNDPELLRLLLEGQERAAELERIRGEVLDLRGKHSAALASYRVDVAKLTDKNTLQRQALDRFAKEQVQLVRAMRRLVEAIAQCDRTGWCLEARSVLTKILSEAKEVLALVDVPFS